MADRELPNLGDFPIHSTDKIRFRDTDQLGHVNNAVFSTYFETGRAELLVHPEVDAPQRLRGGEAPKAYRYPLG